MRTFIFSILAVLFSFSAFAQDYPTEGYYYVRNKGLWEDYLVDKSSEGCATPDPSEGCLVRFEPAGTVSGYILGKEVKNAQSFYIVENNGLYWNSQALCGKEHAGKYVFVAENGSAVDAIKDHHVYAIVDAETMSEPQTQSLVWISESYSSENLQLSLGAFSCEWEFCPYKAPVQLSFNIMQNVDGKMKPVPGAFVYWGKKKISTGSIVSTIAADESKIVGLRIPLHEENGVQNTYGLSVMPNSRFAMVSYIHTIQIKTRAELKKYAAAKSYLNIVNANGKGFLTFDPKLDARNLMVTGAWNVENQNLGRAEYVNPALSMSGNCTWQISFDEDENIILQNTGSGLYLGFNPEGYAQMSNDPQPFSSYHFEDGVATVIDPLNDKAMGVDLSNPDHPLTLIDNSLDAKWYVLATNPETTCYYEVISNHEQGGIHLFADSRHITSGTKFYFPTPITPENFRTYLSATDLAGYEKSIKVTLDETTHQGKIEVTYSIDFSKDGFFNIHPSVMLSNYAQYHLNNPIASTDLDEDRPLLQATTVAEEFGSWQLEYVESLEEDIPVKIGMRYCSRATDVGALSERIIPAGTGVYRLRLKDKGYLRFIPEAVDGESQYSARRSQCFNFTSIESEAEEFIFWSADQWLSQSDIAKQIGITAVSHAGEYFIVPKSCLGYYNQDAEYDIARSDNYLGFGQLMLSFTGFRGSTSAVEKTLLGIDCMREIRYDSNDENYYDLQAPYSYPWALTPLERRINYFVDIRGAADGAIKYGGVEYRRGDYLVASDLLMNQLRVKPVLGKHYRLWIAGSIIHLNYLQGEHITSLDQLQEGHLYTIRSYMDRGYMAHNQNNAYNKQLDPNGVMLIGTYNDDVSYVPAPTDYCNDKNMQWCIVPIGRNSEQGRPLYHVAAQGSGRFLGCYYQKGQNNNYSFFGTQLTLSPRYGVGIEPGSEPGTFMFVSEMEKSYNATISDTTFEYVINNNGFGEKGWDALRVNYAYASPESSNCPGMLNNRGTWCFGDGVLFNYHRDNILEANPKAMLWIIEDTGLLADAPYFDVSVNGLPVGYNPEEVNLQIRQGTNYLPTFYGTLEDGMTRILSPYSHNSVSNVVIECTLNGTLGEGYEVVESSHLVDDWTFTVCAKSGIEELEIDQPVFSNCYDLQGRGVEASSRGLKVVGGRISLVR